MNNRNARARVRLRPPARASGALDHAPGIARTWNTEIAGLFVSRVRAKMWGRLFVPAITGGWNGNVARNMMSLFSVMHLNFPRWAHRACTPALAHTTMRPAPRLCARVHWNTVVYTQTRWKNENRTRGTKPQRRRDRRVGGDALYAGRCIYRRWLCAIATFTRLLVLRLWRVR